MLEAVVPRIRRLNHCVSVTRANTGLEITVMSM
jgi:hypothetical protein